MKGFATRWCWPSSDGALLNQPLPWTNGSVAALPLPFAAERQYRSADAG